MAADRDLAAPIPIFVGFARALRSAGLPGDRAADFVEAVGRLDPGRRDDVYWAGRATLCDEPDDIRTFDRVFDRWFSTAAAPGESRAATSPARSVERARLGADEAEGAGDDRLVAVLASDEEQLRHRDVAELSAAEKRHLATLFGRLDVRVPTRRGHRRHRSHRGDIDAARTVRDQLRRAGEPGPLRYRRTRPRPRRVVFLIDVSGSMESYADSLLRLAHRAVTAAPRTTEVFTLGTRLTRVTPALRHTDPERALEAAGQVVPDWSGGTRLGEVLRAFVDRWGQRGVARGAVIVIASDGWERGDPALLGEQMRRLRRLAHVVLWSNPHRGKPGYAPVQGGITAALPAIDGLVAGHSFATFAELLEMVADA